MTDYSRQTDVFDPRKWFREVHIIGLGSIGSTVLLQLMKMGVPRIHMYDDDRVEPHNVPPQPLYRPSDAKAGRLKIEAAQLYAEREELDTELILHPIRIDEGSIINLNGIVIAGVDSMESRQNIWYHVRGNGLVELYLDGRIGGDGFQLHAFNPSSPSAVFTYERWLVPVNGIAQLAYGERGINYPCYMLAGLVGSILASFSRGKPPQERPYRGNLKAVVQGDGKIPIVTVL